MKEPGRTPAGCRALLFDFDGTLTRPNALDFASLRKALGCRADANILDYIDGLHVEEKRRTELATLDAFETAAARASYPNAGAEDLTRLLRARGIPFGILSRNTRECIRIALENFPLLREHHFAFILTRQNSGRPKPNPDGVLRAAELFGLPPHEVLVVGDFVYDIAAGSAAGAPTVLVTNGHPLPPFDPAPDHTVTGLSEIEALLDP